MDTQAQGQGQTQTLSSRSDGGVRKKEWTVVMREKESWPLIKRGFTEAQRKELHEQAVINRHIAAGLPVPLHLLLPIWKSVVSSLGPISIYKQYPSFLGYILQGFDCRNTMDPEPERCRRTDGKKWRCSRDVLSDQKYCERHIHRGRHRSRKLVEEKAPKLASPPTLSLTTTTIPEPNNIGSVSVGLQLMTAATATATTNFCNKRACYASGSGAVTLAVAANPQSRLACGMGFSPKSVLQGRVVATAVVAEPGRCRRTDGKKWRCRREVVTDQKYCPRHMHRGAKRIVGGSNAAPPLPRPSPDTNLCISIPASPRSSASSDTTITDTSN